MTEPINSAAKRIRLLYAGADEAKNRGDNARAYALLQEVLPLLEPAGELQTKYVVLMLMGHLLAEQKSYLLALERWGQAAPLAEAQGNVSDASLILDKMAKLHASQGAWRRARQCWQQALELDARLGDEHNLATTLVQLASAAAYMDEKLEADRLWNEALTRFELTTRADSAVGLLWSMQQVAIETDDWSDALRLRERALRLAEAAVDVPGQILALTGMARTAHRLKQYAEAVATLERARALALELGDANALGALQERLAQCQADQRGEQHRPRFPAHSWRYASVSEYDVRAHVAPYFLVGERWASLHANGISVSRLNMGDVTVTPAAIARLSPQARLVSGAPFAPESAAADLTAALAQYSPECAAALLAGYSRYGYEVVDRHQPGFTDELLNHFGVPEPRPRPARVVDIPAQLAALGVQIRPSAGQFSLVLVETTGPSVVWQHAAESAFRFVLALLVAGVDCRALWARDAATAWPAFKLLPLEGAVVSEQYLQSLLPPLPRSLKLAGMLACALSRLPYEPWSRFNLAMPIARQVLTTGPDADAMALGDILIHVALYCAKLLESRDHSAAAGYLQRAIVLLGYTARGQRSDEARLQAITQAMWRVPELYPLPQADGDWLLLCNSLLITLCALASKSVAAQALGEVGVLRSAAIRGVCIARHALQLSYARANSPEPEVAARGQMLFRETIKNYSSLLHEFARSVQLEHEATGRSAWLRWIERPDDPPHLAREQQWIMALLQAAAGEGSSLDVARPFMRALPEFCAEEHTHFVLPVAPTVQTASN